MSRHQSKFSSEDDYCTYVSKMEKKTSMTEGPHFPHVHTVIKHKEFHEEDGKSHLGILGRPRQKEYFEEESYEVTETAYVDDNGLQGECMRRQEYATKMAAWEHYL